MKSSLIALGLLVALGLSGAWYYTTRPPVHTQSSADSIISEATSSMTMQLSSSTFQEGGSIPSKYTCDGQRDLNPPLTIAAAPPGAASLVLIVDDPDVPKALKPDGVFDHWILFNIPPDTTTIGEGKKVGTLGANGAGNPAYTGPCPPIQYEPSTHRYVFTLYALDAALPLEEGASKTQVLAAMEGHILTQAQLVGTYHKAQ